MKPIELPGPVVSAYWLREHLSDVHVVDVRWHLGQPGEGRRDWLRGHIPGAVFLDLDRDLSDRSEPLRGRHPLPDPTAFARCLADHGLDPHTPVVAYDDHGGSVAARLWWMLGWLGGPPAAVLDGGLRAWRDAGGGLEVGDITVHPVRVWAPAVDDARWIDVEAVRDDPGLLVLDARAPERFRGEVEPVDPIAGHVPGAVNAPWTDNLHDGRLRDAAALRAHYEGLGVRDPARVVCMCGSGVTACLDLLALEVAGLRGARLFPGSWSEWSRRGLPAER